MNLINKIDYDIIKLKKFSISSLDNARILLNEYIGNNFTNIIFDVLHYSKLINYDLDTFELYYFSILCNGKIK